MAFLAIFEVKKGHFWVFEVQEVKKGHFLGV